MNMLTKVNKFGAYALTVMLLSGFGFSTVQAAPTNHHDDRRQEQHKDPRQAQPDKHHTERQRDEQKRSEWRKKDRERLERHRHEEDHDRR